MVRLLCEYCRSILTIQATNLRQLMRNKEAERTTKITHALARYNNLDQLVCKLCNQVIKGEALWQPHLLSKRHKELFDDLKAGKFKPVAKPAPSVPEPEPAPVPVPAPVSDKKRKEPESANAAANNHEDRRPAEEDVPKRAASALPDGFFDDPRAQQVVEDELTKAAFARLSDARAPSTSAAPLSVPVVSAVDQMVAEFEKEVKAVVAPAPAVPVVAESTEPAGDFDDDDIDQEAQQLLQEQEEQKQRFEAVRKKALENAKKIVLSASAKAAAEEDEAEDEQEMEGLLLDWRSKNV